MVSLAMTVSDERHLIYKFIRIPRVASILIFFMKLESLEIESIICVAPYHVLQLMVVWKVDYFLRLFSVSKVTNDYLSAVWS